MAIRVPDLGLGDGKTGDTELKIRQDYNHNFNDQTNAASRLVGPEAGNLLEVGANGLAASSVQLAAGDALKDTVNGFYKLGSNFPIGLDNGFGAYGIVVRSGAVGAIMLMPYANQQNDFIFRTFDYTGIASYKDYKVWTDKNATKDANGFLKGASPVVDMYDNKLGLNYDAEQQGGITFEKLGVGDYLIKGSLGFAKEGWHIETPKDTNGNVLVAVVETQLENNDLSIKAYAKRFDDETGDIVPNLTKPRDIPDGRFISLRLHELPKEPPVMPTETKPEV